MYSNKPTTIDFDRMGAIIKKHLPRLESIKNAYQSDIEHGRLMTTPQIKIEQWRADLL